ncbi:MAG: class I SAM-dependent methyltransferase [Planctomycetia bacterium]|nr:class I SAM-dependent methyltransferase [Planctomycetia bacterium]
MTAAKLQATISAWEAAYRRFETPAQEQAKFLRRLKSLGAHRFNRGLAVLELFCGRGNGLVAWERLGFTNVSGLDISAELLSEYRGPARTVVGDARRLPFRDGSFDVVAVQGGLHHLQLMDDLSLTAGEMWRVLRPGGKLLVVEPWRTPFLDFVHAACERSWLRAIWPKLDALATMIDHERETYEDWLGRPQAILDVLRSIVVPQVLRVARGKMMLLGVRREARSNVTRQAA